MKQKLINLTPHAITIACVSESITVEPSGTVARVETNIEVMPTLDDKGEQLLPFSVYSTSYGLVQGLPNPVENTWYIVSGMVRQALGTTRPDVLAPDTGASAMRRDGQVVAVVRMIGQAKDDLREYANQLEKYLLREVAYKLDRENFLNPYSEEDLIEAVVDELSSLGFENLRYDLNDRRVATCVNMVMSEVY